MKIPARILVSALLLLGCYEVRLPVYEPLGLVTSPNKYGQYPAGACSTARNVCMRDPGLLTSMPATRAYRADIMSSSYVIRKLYPAGASMLAFGDNSGAWQARWVTGSASTAITTTPAGLSAATFDVAQINVVKARERYFVTSLNDGVLVLDSEGDTTVRAAGFRAPLLSHASTNLSGQSLVTGYCARYISVWRRKQSDGYETRSEPSTPYLFDNAYATTVDPSWRSKFASNADVQAGDYIELYRTKQQTSGTDPGVTYYLVKSALLSGTDISTGYIDIKDTLTDDMLGEEFYANPGQNAGKINGVTAAAINSPPGLATDTWTFKERTFYAVRRLPSFLKLRINGVWAGGIVAGGSTGLTTAGERTTGIGTREFTGDTTAANPTITNVSDTTGVVLGQRVSSLKFIAGGKVTGVTATTITFDTNATFTSVAATHRVYDVLEVNGIEGSAAAMAALFEAGNASVMLAGPFNTVSQDAVVLSEEGASIQFSAGGSDLYGAVVGATLIIRQGRYGDGVLTVRGTNAQNYSPPIADIAATATNGDYDERFNRLQWSKDSAPEAAPPLQELVYGHGTHYRGIPTVDATWLFASDGLWRLSGSGDRYAADPIDPQLILAGRNAVGKLGDRIYAYTERGLVRISDSGGIELIARKTINDLLPGAAYADTWDTFITCDELHREVWLSFRSGSATHSYVYNEVTESFVDVIDSEWSAGVYAPYLRSMVVGVVSSQPDVYYFEDDTSTTRMANADVRFQPFTGDDDAFSMKEFVRLNYVFSGITGSATVTPRFGTTNYNPRTLVANTFESRMFVDIPGNAPAFATSLRPGFSFATGGTTNAWAFNGFSVKWEPAGDEVR